jgi:hypothetical protein
MGAQELEKVEPHTDRVESQGEHTEALGGVGCWEVSVDERSMQLLKVMREQVGETTGRAVDAGAAAKSLGMYPGTLDRSLLYLVRAGYIEEYADRAMSSRNGMFLITLQGIAAIDNA